MTAAFDYTRFNLKKEETHAYTQFRYSYYGPKLYVTQLLERRGRAPAPFPLLRTGTVVGGGSYDGAVDSDKKAHLKEKAAEEFRLFWMVAAYLAAFFVRSSHIGG